MPRGEWPLSRLLPGGLANTTCHANLAPPKAPSVTVLPAVPPPRGPASGAGPGSAQKGLRPGREAGVNCACAGRESRALRKPAGRAAVWAAGLERPPFGKVTATGNASASFHCPSSGPFVPPSSSEVSHLCLRRPSLPVSSSSLAPE